ncbi:hypothetical protein ACIQU3_19905 [Streptomyces sp. NPDC101110]|uniref:hypothetical protein n=1 Tax=unclassified Streptomyces TaxID=2593676 RepID=UPI003825CEF6
MRRPVLLRGPARMTLRHFPYAGAPCGPDVSTPVRLVEQGRLHPEIGRTADWAGTAGTLVDLRERRIRGKAVPLTGGSR